MGAVAIVNTAAYGATLAYRIDLVLMTMPPNLIADSRTDRARLSSTDWEAGALDLLAEQGVSAVAVEPLARRLGVTKGSFYWHFPSREALLKAALERWEKLDEETVFEPLEGIADPAERLRELFVRTSKEMRSHVLYSLSLIHI